MVDKLDIERNFLTRIKATDGNPQQTSSRGERLDRNETREPILTSSTPHSTGDSGQSNWVENEEEIKGVQIGKEE